MTTVATAIALLLGFFLPETLSKKVAFVTAVVLAALFAVGTHGSKKTPSGPSEARRRTNWGQLVAVAIIAAVLSAAIISARYEWREVSVVSLGEQIVPGAGQEGGESWRAPAVNQKKKLLVVAQSYPPNTRNIIILDLRSGKLVEKLEDKFPGQLPAVGEQGRLAFSPDGELLAIGGLAPAGEGTGDTLWLVRTFDWQRMPCKMLSKDAVSDLAFSPDGLHLAAAQDRIYVWDVHQPRLAPELLDATVTPAEQKFVHTIGEPSDEGETKFYPRRIAFSSDGKKILALYKQGILENSSMLRVWHLTEKRSEAVGESTDLEGQRVTDVYFDPKGDPYALTFSDGGETGTKTNTLFHVFSLSRNVRTFDFETGLSPFGDILTAISPNFRYIAVGQVEVGPDKVLVFKFGDRSARFTASDRHPVGVTFSPDGQRLIVTGRQRDSAWFFAPGLWVFGMRIPWLH